MARSGFPNCSLQRDTANVGAKRRRSILLCSRWRFHIMFVMFVLAGSGIFPFLNPRLERYGNDTGTRPGTIPHTSISQHLPTRPTRFPQHPRTVLPTLSFFPDSKSTWRSCFKCRKRSCVRFGAWVLVRCRVPLPDVHGRVHFRACAAGCLCQICMAVGALEPAFWCCRVPRIPSCPAYFRKFVGMVLRAKERNRAAAAARQTATALALSLLLEKGGLVLGIGIGPRSRKWEPQEAASME